MDLNLKGKRAIVCGSTQGIGKASALELATLGADVTLLARDEDKLKVVLKELDASQGQVHGYLVADFDSVEEVRKTISSFVKNNTAQILINNTGGPKAGNIMDAQSEEFAKTFSRHVVCSQIMVQSIVPAMKEARYGRIINIISTSVRMPIRGLGVSNTVRGAMASWAKTLSLELAPFGITVNNILPGSTKTGRIEELIQTRARQLGRTEDDIRKEMISEIPAGRMAEAAELAAAVAFLASPAASYINGVSLPVDGGRIGAI
jgi:3-oxoacyl-[acyl-carrier protein] reductase